MAAASGTTDIVLTPHVSPAFPNDLSTLKQAFADLSVASGGILRLHLGCDFHLTYDNLQEFLAKPANFTINGSRYLMVELPDFVPFSPVSEALSKILEEGVIPIITHPERNPSLQSNTRELSNWVARGCLCQVTGQSVLGKFGSRAAAMALRLIKEGNAHVVASDAHDLVHRPPTLKPAHQFLVSRVGESLADQLCTTNPQAIISGEELPPVMKPLSFWSRMRQRANP